MKAAVALIGEGTLAEEVAERLKDRMKDRFRLTRRPDFRDGPPRDADLALVLSDGWSPARHLDAEEAFRQTGTPWLRGGALFGEGFVGPIVRPDRPGCSQCADRRRMMTGRDRKEAWMIKQAIVETGGEREDVWASLPGLRQLALLIAEETERLLEGSSSRTDQRMLLINLTTLTITGHSVLPDTACPICGSMPEDDAEGARIQLRESPKTGPGNYRTRSLGELEEGLLRDYWDNRTGLLNGKVYDLLSPFADASVNLPLFEGDEGTAGRTHRYPDSVLAAILEGLERHCGVMPRGKRTAVRDSFRRLGESALDPASVGLHAEEGYARPDFPFPRYDPDREMDWVWGYSFRRERPILVPERLAYYSAGCGEGFVYETSNGCALGGSLEEAIFYGILELAERDSFLLTWYAQLPLPRIDPRSAGDAELDLMIERMRSAAGYDVLLFDATMEYGIPCVWSIAKNRGNRGLNLLCAGGAHPDPVRAAKGSIHELAGMVLALGSRFEEGRETWKEMLSDPGKVRAMEDHSMLYALPEAESRFDFLLDPARPTRSFAEAYGSPAPWNPDLAADLRKLIDAFLKQGLDVVVVDQSSPETLRNGLRCVKVIIPGLLPMTFGYHLTRLAGLERVLRVPAQLGYTEQPLTPAQLNRHPHPFP
ncbi:TOMM precursor leader peptide-binding protein [Cohnella caldifontis]|uniref:TOMM precursor leader peptide-binding protein n=1 Tax=Cohnella caldifontis TaxID=3027471 RepID=UPI0023EBFFCE|nr:TOMM precursor leader peptide-binding protein [Cohnella sp. YIM B05605]